MKSQVAGIILLCAAIFFCQCTPAKKSGTASLKNIDSSLLGNFTDDYKIKYTVTTRSFTQHPGVVYKLLSYNKKKQYFIAQNDTANITDGGLFTRIDIMRFNNMAPWSWGFCLTAYKAASKEEAINTVPADRANPKKGCGGYPFSRMKRLN
ncbi:MAG: hypothetical protein EOP53_13995 [Sphingobacteriales bacterium]|nr:MAG: hypothetical protein EOP53_13995 [Sphingobacteriales bacterium]